MAKRLTIFRGSAERRPANLASAPQHGGSTGYSGLVTERFGTPATQRLGDPVLPGWATIYRRGRVQFPVKSRFRVASANRAFMRIVV